MKVGALSTHAHAPHFYGFTWSAIGVATEYVKDCARRQKRRTDLACPLFPNAKKSLLTVMSTKPI